MTASLLKKYNVDPKSIGRLDVGTETLIDKSKSVKTQLMPLFGDNTDIEGIDSKNACYGGTAALFNAVNWIESSSWDGRYALVVAGDIAIYAAGGARPVGGAGAVAMLVGPNAPLALEPVHGSHMANVYDFYKPHLLSEYPEVDGPLTQTCYPTALEKSYDAFRAKDSKRKGGKGELSDVTLDDFDYICFHSPYGKLVQKGYARLLYNDYLANPSDPKYASVPAELGKLPRSETTLNKDVEKVFMGLSKEGYAKKSAPSSLTSKQLGNMYTASLYGALASLLWSTASAGTDLTGKRIGMYSYGSGLAATFFTIRVTRDTSDLGRKLDLQKRIDEMEVRSCEEYLAALKLREETTDKTDWTPKGKVEDIWPGGYYLEHNDAKHRRKYLVRS